MEGRLDGAQSIAYIELACTVKCINVASMCVDVCACICVCRSHAASLTLCA